MSRHVHDIFERMHAMRCAERDDARVDLEQAVRALELRPVALMVCGSRHFDTTGGLVHEVLDDLPVRPRVLMHGEAGGVDTSADEWAAVNGVPVVGFPADWTRYGNGAGPIRNRHMRQLADAVVAVWDGRTEGCGTWDTVEKLMNREKWCAWQFAAREGYRVIVGLRWVWLWEVCRG